MRRQSIKYKFLLTVTSVFLFVFFAGAGNIVYPWRAVPAIVKAGNNLEILFNNISFSEIDSVVLTGPFNRVKLKIDSVFVGKFEYDSYTKQSVNNKIRIQVPESTPEELYDLTVHSGSEMNVSVKSVKVVSEFSASHSFIHISDPHVSRQWVGTPENGYAKELELLDRFVEVANIIAPDFVIVTGDVIHHYTLFDANSTGWGVKKAYDADKRPLVEEKYKNYFDGAKGFSGVHGFNAPVFSIPGNHDSYGVSRKDNMAMALQWNQICGKRVYGFSYAGTRLFAIDDYLGDPLIDIPDSSPLSGLQGKVIESFIKESGSGKIRILAQHRPDRIDTSFIDKNRVNILLNGHRHDPLEEKVGSTPTLSIRPGTVCRSGEVTRWKETLGFFRIFYINEDQFEYTAPLRFCKNPTLPFNQLEMNLTLDFKYPNDGSAELNEATIHNLFDVALPQCKIRFIMKKGNYKVEGGIIRQVIQAEYITVVDVYIDVNRYNDQIVKIISI